MFQEALAAAPADADFIGYKSGDGWTVIARRSDGICHACATLDSLGYPVFIAGVSANRRSFWSAESRQFITGTMEQLGRESA